MSLFKTTEGSLRQRALAVGLVAMIAVSACSSHAPATRTAEVDRVSATENVQREVTEDGLRLGLMSFADRFSTLSIQGLVALEQASEDPRMARQVGLSHRTYTLTALFELAIAPNISTAMLDMLALTTLTRMVWEDHWRGTVFGAAADPVVEALRELEGDAWSLSGKVLSPAQLTELREIVETWRREHPDQIQVSHLRLADISRPGQSTLAAAEAPGGLFGVGRALSDLEAAQRLFERTMWYLTRLQLVARWQAEQAVAGVVTNPEIAELLSNFDGLADLLPELPAEVADRSLTVSRELLKEVTVEREAAVNQILLGFAEERRRTLDTIASAEGPRAALNDARMTIEATRDLIERIDGLVVRLEPVLLAEDTGAAVEPSRPFDIMDYRGTIQEATRTVERLNDLVGSVDKVLASPGLVEGIPLIQEEGERLVGSIFRAGLSLIAILLVGLLLILVLYRWVVTRVLPMKAPEAGQA